MSKLPLAEAVERFRSNDERLAQFVNDAEGTGVFETDQGLQVPTLPALAEQAQSLEARLAVASDPSKGAGPLGIYDQRAPAYLKTVSDMLNGVPVDFGSRWKATPGHAATSAASISEKLQSAYDSFVDMGVQGILHLGRGFWGLDSGVKPRANVALKGAGRGQTTLYQLSHPGDGVSMLGIDDGDQIGGCYELCDLTLHGIGDRTPSMLQYNNNAYIGKDGAALVAFRNVESKWARWYALGGRGDRGVGHGCYVHRGFRDGLNLTDCLIADIYDCEGEYLYDDVFGIHGRNNYADNSIQARRSSIRNVRFRHANGVKILGAENCIIDGVRSRFARGYAVYLGFDSLEGLNNPIGNLISNITALDTMNSALDGQGTQLSAILLLAPSRSLGTGANTLPALAGSYDPMSKTVVTGDSVANLWGASPAKIGGRGLNLSNIVAMQTLNAATAQPFSAFGFGQSWGPSGFHDPSLTGTVAIADGKTQANGNFDAIRLQGDWEGVVINESVQVSGFRTGISVRSEHARNIQINANISRCATPIDLTTASGLNRDSDITVSATIDLDPYCEVSTRYLDENGAPTGEWISDGQQQGTAVFASRRKGVALEGGSYRNCARLIGSGDHASTHLIRNNRIYADWSNVTTRYSAGVRTIPSPADNTILFEDSNPQSPTYRQAGGGAIFSASSMPTAGWYYRGAFVRNTATAVSSGKVLLGWSRLTSGNAHITGVDWAPLYGSTS